MKRFYIMLKMTQIIMGKGYILGGVFFLMLIINLIDDAVKKGQREKYKEDYQKCYSDTKCYVEKYKKEGKIYLDASGNEIYKNIDPENI